MLGQPGFIDTLSGNFIPYFLVPNILHQAMVNKSRCFCKLIDELLPAFTAPDNRLYYLNRASDSIMQGGLLRRAPDTNFLAAPARMRKRHISELNHDGRVIINFALLQPGKYNFLPCIGIVAWFSSGHHRIIGTSVFNLNLFRIVS